MLTEVSSAVIISQVTFAGRQVRQMLCGTVATSRCIFVLLSMIIYLRNERRQVLNILVILH